MIDPNFKRSSKVLHTQTWNQEMENSTQLMQFLMQRDACGQGPTKKTQNLKMPISKTIMMNVCDNKVIY